MKPPTALVPPTMAVPVRSADHSAASKERELLPPRSSTQLQPTSGQDNLKGKQSQKVSKLRPPTASFVKSKQVSSQKSTPVPPEPQNTSLKSNIPRPPVQRKEGVQTHSAGAHCGDSVPSARHSRLPKPKTHWGRPTPHPLPCVSHFPSCDCLGACCTCSLQILSLFQTASSLGFAFSILPCSEADVTSCAVSLECFILSLVCNKDSIAIFVVKQILKSVMTTNARMLHYLFQDGRNYFLPLFELLDNEIAVLLSFLVLSTR